jgi:amidohydrolase
MGTRIPIEDIRALAAELAPSAVDMRRVLHRHPELGDEEFQTTALVGETLDAAGLMVRNRTPKTGLTVDVGSDGPAVGFRADMDALPIEELTDVPFRSRVEGVMHACGHDAHTAIGVHAAILLHRLGVPAGRVRFLFQPAEELFPGGAYDMVRDGVVDDLHSLFAFHVDPSIPAGVFGLRSGAITSSSDRFEITLEGPGGHTARPHETVDLISAAARVVSDVPSMLTRMIDARRALVMVFGQIHGGKADNVIPTSVVMSGTCRTLDREVWDELPARLERLAQDAVTSFGAKATVHYQRGIPPVVNDGSVVDRLRADYVAAFGHEAVIETHTSLGAEDFSRYLEQTRGALVRLGAGIPGRHLDLHSASFDMDEAAIEHGLVAAAVGVLGLLGQASSGGG